MPECLRCSNKIAGWPYTAANVATILAIVMAAAWMYAYVEAWDSARDNTGRDPTFVVSGLALMSAIFGLIVGLVLYIAARITIFLGRDMLAVRAVVRRALRGGGRSCWRCKCDGHGAGRMEGGLRAGGHPAGRPEAATRRAAGLAGGGRCMRD